MAGNGRSGGQERVWLIAIDYHTVAGTARAECKGDQRLKRAEWSESVPDSNGLTETQERGVLGSAILPPSHVPKQNPRTPYIVHTYLSFVSDWFPPRFQTYLTGGRGGVTQGVN